MRYLLGLAAAAALMVAAGSAGAAVVKPSGLADVASNLGTLELVKKSRGQSFCVACPIPVPFMSKNCVGTSASCMAANPLCYVVAGPCVPSTVAAPAKPAKGKKARKGKGGKAKKAKK